MIEWIKIEKPTPRKIEVLAIANILKIDPDHAFGLCFRFWCWCDDNLRKGNADGVTFSLVDSLLGRKGFAAAMASVGWLSETATGILVPNFDRHLSKSAKNRAETAKRVSDHKERKRKGNAESVTNPLPKALPELEEEDSVFTTVNTHSADAEPAKKTETETPPAEKPPPQKTQPPSKKAKPPDELFDAIAEVTGVSVKLRASLIAKICKELRAEEPPFTPAEVKEFGRRFHEFCPFAVGERDRPELMELRNHVDKVRRPPPTKPPGGRSGKPAGGGGRMRTEPGEYAAFDNHGFSPEDLAGAAAETPPDENAF